MHRCEFACVCIFVNICDTPATRLLAESLSWQVQRCSPPLLAYVLVRLGLLLANCLPNTEGSHQMPPYKEVMKGVINAVPWVVFPLFFIFLQEKLEKNNKKTRNKNTNEPV